MTPMPEIGEIITHKVGPLPMWGWAVGVGGLGFVVLKMRGNKSATTSPSTATSGAQYSTGTNGQQGANLGGYDNSSSDAQLMGLQAAAGQTQTAVTALGSQVGALGQAISQLPSQLPSTLPVVAQPAAPQAPVSTPTPPPSQVLGSIIGKADAAWKAGLGEYYLVTPDLYGAASPGQPGYGTHGAGANEVAAYLNKLYPTAKITPQQLSSWNGGQQWYTPGQQLYIGSFAQGVGH